jgi:hypothetical protein
MIWPLQDYVHVNHIKLSPKGRGSFFLKNKYDRSTKDILIFQMNRYQIRHIINEGKTRGIFYQLRVRHQLCHMTIPRRN